jgi:hypothetical protein
MPIAELLAETTVHKPIRYEPHNAYSVISRELRGFLSMIPGGVEILQFSSQM